MTGSDVVDAAANDAFTALQAKARAEFAGNTQPLLVVYAVESFLRRLAMSDYADCQVRFPCKPLRSGYGRYWARTSDLRLVEAALSQLS